ncbi:hypothetical protein [Sorangium sp. So ce1024]|uniref:hypothetical protein n=1 Tax=Sorangium sp. So ce1024 TaxID=3133327 RepID=UPI003F033F1D
MNSRDPRRRVLTAEDLTYIGQRLRILDPFPGVRPWNRATLWSAVLDEHMAATKPRDSEAFRELVGALRVLDVLDRDFLRK